MHTHKYFQEFFLLMSRFLTMIGLGVLFINIPITLIGTGIVGATTSPSLNFWAAGCALLFLGAIACALIAKEE